MYKTQDPWIPALGRSPEEENGNPLQYSFFSPFQYSSMENPMERGTWQAAVLGVTRTWLQQFRTADTRWPGLSWGLRQRRICRYCRRDLGLIPGLGISLGEGNGYPPTMVFLPRQFHEQRSLEGYSPWGYKEWDMTEWLTQGLFLSSSKAYVMESLFKC